MPSDAFLRNHLAAALAIRDAAPSRPPRRFHAGQVAWPSPGLVSMEARHGVDRVTLQVRRRFRLSVKQAGKAEFFAASIARPAQNRPVGPGLDLLRENDVSDPARDPGANHCGVHGARPSLPPLHGRHRPAGLPPVPCRRRHAGSRPPSRKCGGRSRSGAGRPSFPVSGANALFRGRADSHGADVPAGPVGVARGTPAQGSPVGRAVRSPAPEGVLLPTTRPEGGLTPPSTPCNLDALPAEPPQPTNWFRSDAGWRRPPVAGAYPAALAARKPRRRRRDMFAASEAGSNIVWWRSGFRREPGRHRGAAAGRREVPGDRGQCQQCNN